MERINLNARDVALTLHGPGEQINGATIPENELGLLITSPTAQVLVAGPWLLLRRLAEEGLMLPLPESFTPVVFIDPGLN